MGNGGYIVKKGPICMGRRREIEGFGEVLGEAMHESESPLRGLAEPRCLEGDAGKRKSWEGL